MDHTDNIGPTFFLDRFLNLGQEYVISRGQLREPTDSIKDVVCVVRVSQNYRQKCVKRHKKVWIERKSLGDTSGGLTCWLTVALD